MNPTWNLLLGGNSMPRAKTRRERMVYGLGRWLAGRHAGATIDRTCLIHPEAAVCPRYGKLTIGARTTVAAHCAVQGEVAIGDDCSVQSGGTIVGFPGDGPVRIGNMVRIATHCMIIAQNHVAERADIPMHGQGIQPAPITIEDDVWLGGFVKIVAGVTIGTGSIVGAGSVVTRDIPPFSIAAGVPARVIKSRKP